MTKDVEAFRTISEVAGDLDLPQHVLRFWESKFPQIRPLQRAGGRRYYRPAEVELLKAVKTFLYGHGYTIRGVQRIIKEQGVKAAVLLAGADPIGSSAIDDDVTEEFVPAPDSERVAEPGRRQRIADLLREVEACSAILRAAHLQA